MPIPIDRRINLQFFYENGQPRVDKFDLKNWNYVVECSSFTKQICVKPVACKSVRNANTNLHMEYTKINLVL